MNVIGNQAGNTLNSMAFALMELLGLYLLAPMLAAGILLYTVRVRGKSFKLLIGIVGLIGLYFMMTRGIQGFSSKVH
ncbi:hypothetical protein P9847_01310 [Paenibacillus chibensis]|uniref:Uncharacterized protein n=1 Tax=Paenibacillus chibensis TaxID=59846 RepID=A0ABU6PM54_9BACL|nr:hypothetical protein [Paenibacillus chibensis]